MENPIDFTYLSLLNAKFAKQPVQVANGAVFNALLMSDAEKYAAANILYIHIHRKSRKCYVGITVQEAGKRWFASMAYALTQHFGRALANYGWEAFDTYVLAFADNRTALNEAEVIGIAAAGGHKSKFTYNLSPGGDMVADNDKPVIGMHLPTGESREFKSGADAARTLGFKKADYPSAVARGEILSVKDWWFRFVDDESAVPPELWGRARVNKYLREHNARPVIGIHFETKETRYFETMDIAADVLNVQQGEVSAVANGKAHSAGGWWFHFENDDRVMPAAHGFKATRLKRDKKIYAVHLHTGERREFRNCTVADIELELYRGTAASVALGERTSAIDWWFTYDKLQGSHRQNLKGLSWPKLDLSQWLQLISLRVRLKSLEVRRRRQQYLG